MAEITLKYNAEDEKAKEHIRNLLRKINYEIVDVFFADDLNLDEAIKDVEEGRTTTFENFEEYKDATRKMLENV